MSTIGPILKRLREEKGTSLRRLAEETRIPRRTLQAMEDGELEGLPAPVYIRGFIHAYCAALGVDSHELVAMYDSEVYAQEMASELHLTESPGFMGVRDEVLGAKRMRVTQGALLAVAAVTFLVALFVAVGGPGDGAPEEARAPVGIEADAR